MTERACCDAIVETTGRVKSLEEWRDEYVVSAQRWRELHVEDNRADAKKLSEQLDRIENRLTTFVNPVLAVVITTLGTIIGLLAGALWVLAR